MNLSIAAILGTEESGSVLPVERSESRYGLYAKKVAVVERFKQERRVLCCICLGC